MLGHGESTYYDSYYDYDSYYYDSYYYDSYSYDNYGDSTYSYDFEYEYDIEPPTLSPKAPFVAEDQLIADPYDPDVQVSAVLTIVPVLENGAVWTDPGATATDALDGDISDDVRSLRRHKA